MDLRSNTQIHGLQPGVVYNKYEPHDEFNSRINSRQFPDSPLEPNFSPRSVPTKYTTFPMVNQRKPEIEPKIPYIKYDGSYLFNPGTSRAPISGLNINLETNLRNQTIALQHGASQNVYVPSSTSDLYNVSVISRPSIQPHPKLFTKPQFDQSIHPNVSNIDIGNSTFFNHTRTQLRNL
jgi:hypothetical protein